MPRIIKSNGRREPFDEEKLRAGFHKALEKRPVESDRIELSIQFIKDAIRKVGEREIPSQSIWEACDESFEGFRSSCLCQVCICIPKFSRH
jgi:Predicted transcriptional regulator, consists of a Zn-ribbon and ATP-cone domains